MRQRPLYLITILFLIVANSAGLLALSTASRAALSTARATAAELDHDHREVFNESRQLVGQHGQIAAFAFGAFLFSIISWTGSGLRREPGLQSIPLVLMILAVFTQLIQV